MSESGQALANVDESGWFQDWDWQIKPFGMIALRILLFGNENAFTSEAALPQELKPR